MGEPLRASEWSAALAAARRAGYDREVIVSKVDEPTLPSDLPVRRSDFPWSIHKAARAVYREDSPGTHIQIRDYPTFWAVSVDRHNPHYRPVEHATLDVPLVVLVASGALTPNRARRWLFGDRLVPVSPGSLSATLATAPALLTATPATVASTSVRSVSTLSRLGIALFS